MPIFPSAASLISLARKATPSFRWVLGAAGLFALTASISVFGIHLPTLVFGAVILVFCAFILIILHFVSGLRPEMSAPLAASTAWLVMLLFMTVVVLLITSAFFDHPLPFRNYILQQIDQPEPHTSIPKNALSEPDFIGSLPPSLRDANLEKQLAFKARHFNGMKACQPEEEITIFFEPPSALKNPGFVKVQVITFSSEATGRIYIRAYSSQSSGSLANQRVFHASRGGEPHEVLTEPVSFDGELRALPIDLLGSDQVFVVATYPGLMVSGLYQEEDTRKILRDWHQVEVSDLAVRHGINYYFATGSANAKLHLVERYETGATLPDNKEWYLPTPVDPGHALSDKDLVALIDSRVSRIGKIAVTRFTDPPFVEAFELLGHVDQLRACGVTWATEHQSNAVNDVFYITETDRSKISTDSR